MGGYGSGRNGFSTTTKLDEGLRLDINKLKRDGMLSFNSWRSGRLIWTRVSTGEEIGSIGYETNILNPDDMWMRIHYTHTPYGADPIKMDYKIKLTTTQPNFGGKRLWFVCPLMGKKTTVLYSPSGSKWFASRYAYNLQYSSQSKSEHDRAIDKMWRAKDKLGKDGLYMRPKGMHESKYERILNEIDEAEAVCDNYLYQFIERFSSRRAGV